MTEKMGISEQTIAKFESGGSVRSRNMLSKAFDTAIDCILLEREKAELRSCFHREKVIKREHEKRLFRASELPD